MDKIHRWLDTADGLWKILTRNPYGYKISFNERCCCGEGECCGRDLPGLNNNEGPNIYPLTLNYRIEGIWVGACWTGDEVGIITWDGIEGAWEGDVTMDGCNHTGVLRVSCGSSVADCHYDGTTFEPCPGAGSCDPVCWYGALMEITPCVDYDRTPGSPEILFNLCATLNENCNCDPVDLVSWDCDHPSGEEEYLYIAGLGCCGLTGMPPSTLPAKVRITVWE